MRTNAFKLPPMSSTAMCIFHPCCWALARHPSTILRATSRVRIGRISSADTGPIDASAAANPPARAAIRNLPMLSSPRLRSALAANTRDTVSIDPLSSFGMRGKVLAFASNVVLAGLASVAAAEDSPVYRGAAEVVGPAMLSLDGKRIVLYGIDAPV